VQIVMDVEYLTCDLNTKRYTNKRVTHILAFQLRISFMY